MDDLGGNGTKQEPYKVESFYQLQYINQELDACYKLVSDIDATHTEQEFKPIGYGENPFTGDENPFTGTFDGNNYEIRNLSIKQPEQDLIGLFGCIGEKGRVKSLGLADSSIEGSRIVGGLVGRSYKGRVESSYAVNVDVSGEDYVGGLVACNCGKIESSYAVNMDVSGHQSARGFVGDLVGDNFREDNLESCFNMAKLDNPNSLEEPDLVLSKENHRILYTVETNTLYLQVKDKIYSSENVSSPQVQSLVDETDVVKMTDTFRLSVVSARQG